MATDTDYNKLYKTLIKKMPTPEERLEWLKQHQVLAAGPTSRPPKIVTLEWLPNTPYCPPKEPENYLFKFPKTAKFCVTLKHASAFECKEADEDFFDFALKMDGLSLWGYFETEEEVDDLYEKRPCGYNMFVWNRELECVDGSY